MEILAQFRKFMPEPAVRQIYSAVIADLGKRIDALGSAIAKGDAARCAALVTPSRVVVAWPGPFRRRTWEPCSHRGQG